jgi:Zn ribbon nucleic-acid-binding protein
MPSCKNCSSEFTIYPKDKEYYHNLNVPEPTHCPTCRQQRRYAIRNERSLYKVKCHSCQKDIVSMYSPDKPYTAYCPDCWWGDSWDGTTYGQDFDFGPKVRPFFDQFADLQKKVPRNALYIVKSENCDYCNFTGEVKNSYLVFGSVYSEDCMYGSPYYSKDCVDTLVIRNCELCYECTDSRKLYSCMYCQDCTNSNDLLFCFDLQGCQNCIACVGLRNKQYHIENKPYSKEDFENYKKQLDMCNPNHVKDLKTKMDNVKKTMPRHFMPNKSVENVSGNHIYNSKNTQHSFYSDNCEDCAYCAQVVDLKDCYDNNYTEENELCLEYLGMYASKNTHFSTFCRHCFEVNYSEYCITNKNLFGCSGLRNKEYCILNKQYTKEEYEKLVPKIIEHMKKTGEWGEFFPITHSPFGFNETVAQENFPITKEQALTKGYKWKDPDPKEYQPQTYQIPQNINDVPDTILNEILACIDCGKNYKLVKQELKFYRKKGLPIPEKCPNCRHQARLSMRNPYKIFDRKCNKCGTDIKTAYPTDSSEQVFCDKCYLETVY